MTKKKEEIDLRLWLKTIKPWMRNVIKILVEAEEPLTTGEIIDKLAETLDEQALQDLIGEGKGRAQNKILHFLKRLEKHKMAKHARIGYYRIYAWKLNDKIKQELQKLLKETD